MQTSKADDYLDLIQTETATSKVQELVQQAAQDICATAAKANTKPVSKLEWPDSCEKVIEQYFKDHYWKV